VWENDQVHQPTQIIIILCSARRAPSEMHFLFIIILTLSAKWSTRKLFSQAAMRARTKGALHARFCRRDGYMPSQPCNFLTNFAQENEREFATFCTKLTPTGDGQLFDK